MIASRHKQTPWHDRPSNQAFTSVCEKPKTTKASSTLLGLFLQRYLRLERKYGTYGCHWVLIRLRAAEGRTPCGGNCFSDLETLTKSLMRRCASSLPNKCQDGRTRETVAAKLVLSGCPAKVAMPRRTRQRPYPARGARGAFPGWPASCLTSVLAVMGHGKTAESLRGDQRSADVGLG